MRKANRNTTWISRVVAGVLVLQLAAPGIQGIAAAAIEGGEASIPKADLGSSVTGVVYKDPNTVARLTAADAVAAAGCIK
ncbi:hypothetical protein [Paenibacillus typhae]|uniref:Uncharacterized protein n=1 Tax=Paenibacillus typhae TaxID=1174501 RepID=A0A1G8V661_9BACL|nr:hypothetical protein [Paenibacillus typhae]SDJ61616.1 hypothetical protein SAMN05216192_12060 [Paenibacillus typhae]